MALRSNLLASTALVLVGLLVFVFSTYHLQKTSVESSSLSTVPLPQRVNAWLGTLKRKDRQRAINQISAGYLHRKLAILPPRPSRPKIVLYWDGNHNGGAWPMDNPLQWSETLEAGGCSAHCDFFDINADSGTIANADAVIFADWLDSGSSSKFLQERTRSSFQMFGLLGSAPTSKIKHIHDYDFVMSNDATSMVPLNTAHRVWLMSFFQLHQKNAEADVYFEFRCVNGEQTEYATKMIDDFRANGLTVDTYSEKCSFANKKHNLATTHLDSMRKLEIMGSYKYCLVIEEEADPSYVGPLFWQALAAGCLPVHTGPNPPAENLPDPRAIIRRANYESHTELAKFLQTMSDSDYNSRLLWKGGGLKSPAEKLGKEKLIDAQYLSFPTLPCRLCEFLKGSQMVRSAKEKEQIYMKSVQHLVLHPNFRYLFEADFPDRVFETGDQLAYPLPIEDKDDLLALQNHANYREQKRREAIAKIAK